MRLTTDTKHAKRLIAKLNFTYSYILPKFDSNGTVNSTSSMHETSDVPTGSGNLSSVKLLFSNTDSVCYYFEGVEDIYSEMAKNSEKYFNLSDFPEDHKCYSEVNINRLQVVQNSFARTIYLVASGMIWLHHTFLHDLLDLPTRIFLLCLISDQKWAADHFPLLHLPF